MGGWFRSDTRAIFRTEFYLKNTRNPESALELKRGSGYNKRLAGRLRLVDKGRQSRVGLEPGEVRAESELTC